MALPEVWLCLESLSVGNRPILGQERQCMLMPRSSSGHIGQAEQTIILSLCDKATVRWYSFGLLWLLAISPVLAVGRKRGSTDPASRTVTIAPFGSSARMNPPDSRPKWAIKGELYAAKVSNAFGGNAELILNQGPRLCGLRHRHDVDDSARAAEMPPNANQPTRLHPTILRLSGKRNRSTRRITTSDASSGTGEMWMAAEQTGRLSAKVTQISIFSRDLPAAPDMGNM